MKATVRAAVAHVPAGFGPRIPVVLGPLSTPPGLFFDPVGPPTPAASSWASPGSNGGAHQRVAIPWRPGASVPMTVAVLLLGVRPP